VAVEKLDISEIRGNLGDGKCLGDERKSFMAIDLGDGSGFQGQINNGIHPGNESSDHS
jgi:hypothetical protein